MLGILNGDLTEQLTAGHDIAGVLLRCGFLMTLSIGAWQDMRNHRIKLSLIVMSGAAGAVLRCMYIVLDAAIIYRDSGHQIPSYLVSGQVLEIQHGHGCRSGIAVFIPDNKRGCGKGGWMVFSDIGHLSGCIEKSGFAGRRLGICFLLSMVLVFKGIIQGTDRGRLRIPLLPFLIPAGIGVMFL